MDLKKVFLIFFILLIFSVTSASANEEVNQNENIENDFNWLNNQIYATNNSVSIDLNGTTVKWNVTGRENPDLNNGVIINKTVSISNGMIDGDKSARLFYVNSSSLILTNVTLLNGNATNGGAIANNHGTIEIINSTFNGNNGQRGSSILSVSGEVFLDGNEFINDTVSWGEIYGSDSNITISNSVFDRIISNYSSAVFLQRGNLILSYSNFTNLFANKTAGAIAVREANLFISNSKFKNLTSSKNGGAVFSDGRNGFTNILINNSIFEDCSSEFGGALLILNGFVSINGTKFDSNHAIYNGGAIYTSFSELNITDSTLNFNSGENGGALYIDMTNLTVENSYLNDNLAEGDGGLIYSYDSSLFLQKSAFLNSTDLYSMFDGELEINDCDFTGTVISLNNSMYFTLVDGRGITLELINGTVPENISLDSFDLRDYGWVTPVRNQGNMGACWAFGSIAALESALLRFTGIEFDFSENNLQNSMLKYSILGSEQFYEGGNPFLAAAYFASWLGAFPTEDDTYDELGKISQFLMSYINVHVQNIVLIPPRENVMDNNGLKEAILKYGAINTIYYAVSSGDEFNRYFNSNTSAYYNYEHSSSNHAVAIVGWDDNYSASNFVVTPPGDGAFIVKNSWGTSFGDGGYFYISYYDPSLADDYSLGIIITNETYDRNYQYDFSGMSSYVSSHELFNSSNVSYANQFVSVGDELISAVGTYFLNYEDYVIDIYVNDELVHTQKGKNNFTGYNTIILDKAIQIKKGDEFSAVVTKEYVPFSVYSRTHVDNESSFMFNPDEGEWYNLAEENMIACLKVYTYCSTIIADDLTKYFRNSSQFIATVVNGQDEVLNDVNVNLTINGITYSRVSDENGSVYLNINLNPGTYVLNLFSPVDNRTYNFNITVLPTVIAEDIVKYFRNGTQYEVFVTDAQGNPMANQTVTLNVNGVIYERVTDSVGIARLNINLNPGEYIITATANGLSRSNKITVLPTIIGSDIVKYFRNGTQYEVFVTDSHGNPMANHTVTFNINGVLYYRTSDENGIARLNINLNPGEYIITATANDLSVSNSITVLSIIFADDLVKYFGTPDQYEVSILDDNGNPLANSAVYLNVNGVIYERVTDSDGIARLNINLNPGEYIITATSCNGLSVSNNITVLTVKEDSDSLEIIF